MGRRLASLKNVTTTSQWIEPNKNGKQYTGLPTHDGPDICGMYGFCFLQ